jgi:hypothetical protein
MPNTKYNPTPISSYYAPDLYCAGDIPMPHHSFEDFAMPCVYALIETNTEYNMKFARVYTPNPWHPTEIRFYDWILSSDGIWKRTMGSAMTINAARDDWKSRKAKGHIPRDVIVNPLNGEEYEPWDAFAFHFCSHGTYGFHELIRSYKFDYPRKAK